MEGFALFFVFLIVMFCILVCCIAACAEEKNGQTNESPVAESPAAPLNTNRAEFHNASTSAPSNIAEFQNAEILVIGARFTSLLDPANIDDQGLIHTTYDPRTGILTLRPESDATSSDNISSVQMTSSRPSAPIAEDEKNPPTYQECFENVKGKH